MVNTVLYYIIMWLLMFRIISTGKKDEHQNSLNVQKAAVAANLDHSLALVKRLTWLWAEGQIQLRLRKRLVIYNSERGEELMRGDGIESSGGEVCMGQKD